MGGGHWDSKTYTSYSHTVADKSLKQIYRATHIHADLDPKKVPNGIRESRDSADHPESTSIIVALDETGSMGMLAVTIAKKGLGVLIEQINERQPVKDPAVCIMAFGDAEWDETLLQATQFESDNRLIQQLEKLYIEGHGGGNHTESYDAPWYFAANHTKIDCFEKRQKKGYLFTIGDEESPHGLTKEQVKRFFGDDISENLPAKSLLAQVQNTYNVFHIVAEEGDYTHHYKDRVYATWQELLGQHVLPMTDHTKIAEIIVSAIQIMEGEEMEKVITSWDVKTATVVRKAVIGLAPDPKSGNTLLGRKFKIK